MGTVHNMVMLDYGRFQFRCAYSEPGDDPIGKFYATAVFDKYGAMYLLRALESEELAIRAATSEEREHRKNALDKRLAELYQQREAIESAPLF